jgi:hypothetical protein
MWVGHVFCVAVYTTPPNSVNGRKDNNMKRLKDWLFCKIVHCEFLWGTAPDYVWVNDKLHGPYMAKWQWVNDLLAWAGE